MRSIAACCATTRVAIDAATKIGDADTAALFTVGSRCLDKMLWKVEAHLYAGGWDNDLAWQRGSRLRRPWLAPELPQFVFADYFDRDHIEFGVLRVIKEDRVQAGRGFGAHSHRDMEIISYVLEGEIASRDSMGTSSVIRPGDVQRMSAGAGSLRSGKSRS